MRRILLFLSICIYFPLHSQYLSVGSTQVLGNDCFLLTDSVNNQNGQVWSSTLFNLSNKFELFATVNFGSKDNNGGDGIAFMFQQVGGSAGSSGVGNMGFSGILPSIGFEMDVDQNLIKNDPPYDHIALFASGNTDHTSINNLIGPAGINTTQSNFEDGLDHDLHILWDPTTNNYRVWVDCELRINYSGNIVNMFLGGDPNVIWGFTAGTSTSNNRQSICITHIDNGYSMSDTTTCSGDTILLDAGYGNQYTWSPSIGLNNSSSRTPKAFPNQTTTYTVTITDVCGMTKTDSYIHTVLDSNIATIMGDTITCTNKSIPIPVNVKGTAPYSITLLSSLGGSSNYTLDANGNIIISGNPISVTSSTTETFTIIGFNGTGTCVNDFSGSYTITTDILINSTISATDASCYDSCDATAVISIPHYSSNYSFIWSNSSHDSTANNLCSRTYTVTVSNGGGCIATSSITINQPSEVSIAPLPSINSCEGQTQTFTANATGGSGTHTYSWSNGSNTQSINFVPTSDTNFTVTATDANGCISSPVTGSIKMLRPLSSRLPSKTGFCFGDSTTLTVIASGGDGNYNYLWSDSTLTNTNDVKPDSTTLYFVTISDNCGSPEIIDTTEVQVQFIPDDSITVESALCVNQISELEFIPYTSQFRHYVTFGNEPDSTRYYRNINRIFDDTGCVDITVNLVGRYCSKRWTDTCKIKISPTPTAGFDFTPESPTRVSNFEVRITERALDETGYIWYINSDSIGTSPDFIYNLPDSGTYEIYQIVYNDSGCTDDHIDTLYVEQEEEAFYMPNSFSPNGDGLNDLYGPSLFIRNIKNYRFEVFSRFGDLVFETSNPEEFWNGNRQNEGSSAGQDIYIWRLRFLDESLKVFLKQGNVTLFR